MEPNQGKQKSTSTQLTSQDDSLTADCLIRTFMERGNMEDPILKMFFIGGSRPRENETEKDLLFQKNEELLDGKREGLWNEGIPQDQNEGGRNQRLMEDGQNFNLWEHPLLQAPKYGSLNWGGKKIFIRFLIGKIPG